MQTYETYKNSSIDWLGEIPSHWEVKKVKFDNKIINGFAFKSDDIGDEGELLIRIGDINNQELSEYKKINIQKYRSSVDLSKYEVKRNDILIALTGATIGKTKSYQLNQLAFLNQRVGMVRVINGNQNFISYIFNSEIVQTPIILECFGSAQENISINTICNFEIPLPPITEQEAIAAFLDEKCGKIDELVSVKEQQIALLKERRQVVIHEAVTKGIQPNVELKHSGIDWIGEIPSHWEVGPLKYLTTKIVDGAHFTPTYVDEGIPFLRVTDISKSGIDRKIDWNSVKFIPIQEHKELIKRANPEKGDILLSKNGTIGLTRVIDWNEEFSFFVSLCLIKPTKRLSPFYFEFFFNCPLVDRQINDSSSRTSVTNLHLEKIKELLIVLPPISEQEAIVAYLEEQTGKIDQAIALKTEQIEKLKAYKQSLINEVVTGKVKVV